MSNSTIFGKLDYIPIGRISQLILGFFYLHIGLSITLKRNTPKRQKSLTGKIKLTVLSVGA